MSNPYPAELVRHLILRDGTRVVLRPIRPEDRQIEKEFVKKLSDESKYFRFMNALRELNDAMLNRFTQIDYDREMALIAVVCEKRTGNGNRGRALYRKCQRNELRICVGRRRCLATSRPRLGSALQSY